MVVKQVGRLSDISFDLMDYSEKQQLIFSF